MGVKALVLVSVEGSQCAEQFEVQLWTHAAIHMQEALRIALWVLRLFNTKRGQPVLLRLLDTK